MPSELTRRFTEGTSLQAAQRSRDDADLAIYDAEARGYVRGELMRIAVDLVTNTTTYAANREMEAADSLIERAGSSRVKQQIAGSYLAAANQRNHEVLRRGLG